MKKFLLSLCVMSSALCAQAGGLMTNTNYHIAFDRMFARGATTEIDAAYSNPAGLVWGHEGFEMSLNFQKPWQRRNIETSMDNFLGSPYDKEYVGKASAPIVPALFASYHKDRWALSAMIGIVGSGGFVEYEEGVPMFNVPVTASVYSSLFQNLMPVVGAETANVLARDFSLDSQMKGKQYIYGAQVDFAYKILDCLSASAGFRLSYYDGYYKGHVVAVPGAQISQMVGTDPLVNLQLDVTQRAWGFAPIVGLDFHKDKWTVGLRYEFRTKINTENDTKTLSAEVKGKSQEEVMAMFGPKIAAYADGAETRYDMPSLLSVAVGYEFTPRLRGAVEYHFYDDKNAKMGGDRQETLSHGTHEVLAGVEYDINKKVTVSLGGQHTDYGLTDEYQQNTSFACDSYSVGGGAAWNVTDKIRLNFSYFCSLYSDYEKNLTNAYGTPFKAKETYSRTNHVIGVGIDYKF
jgi:long-chain fatty acid transport protein